MAGGNPGRFRLGYCLQKAGARMVFEGVRAADVTDHCAHDLAILPPFRIRRLTDARLSPPTIRQARLVKLQRMRQTQCLSRGCGKPFGGGLASEIYRASSRSPRSRNRQNDDLPHDVPR